MGCSNTVPWTSNKYLLRFCVLGVCLGGPVILTKMLRGGSHISWKFTPFFLEQWSIVTFISLNEVIQPSTGKNLWKTKTIPFKTSFISIHVGKFGIFVVFIVVNHMENVMNMSTNFFKTWQYNQKTSVALRDKPMGCNYARIYFLLMCLLCVFVGYVSKSNDLLTVNISKFPAIFT